MKKIVLTILLSLSSVNLAANPEQHDLVLVTSQKSDISSLSPLQIRKLFLGVPVVHNKQLLHPLSNTSDPYLVQVFLQKVIFLSQHSYERELLSRIYRTGGELPEKYSTNAKLINRLRNIPGTISYMWSGEFKQTTGLKSLGVIWANSNN